MPDAPSVAARKQVMLAEKEEFGPQFVIELHPVAIHWDLHVLEDVFSMQNAVLLADIKHFNGKDGGNAIHLFARKDQWSGMMVICPPLHSWSQRVQHRGGEFADNAQQVNVRKTRMEFFRGRRAEQSDALQVCPAGALEPLHKFS